jgi:histidine decarboxylase
MRIPIFVLILMLLGLTSFSHAEPRQGLSLTEVVDGAIGPFRDYCDGYGNPGAKGLGYINLLKLEIGLVKADMDEVLDGIVSYDRAETLGAYLGQINMLEASSFNGVNGAVWGYHLARAEGLAEGEARALFFVERHDGIRIPVYPMDPLLDAGQRLLGVSEMRRFPVLPGAHVVCAVKSKTVRGPNSIWCAAALAIAEDREHVSNLFIEDVGDSIPAESAEARERFLDELQRKIALSIVRCGQDSNVLYKEIYVGYKTAWIPEGHVGCAITCAPYLVLPTSAIPKGKRPSDLINMTLSQWEKALDLPPLPTSTNEVRR